MTSYNGELYVTGRFNDPLGQPCGNVAAWNGSSWRYPGCGLWAADYFDREGRSLHVHEGNLYVGGYFEPAGGQPAFGVARWNGTVWSTVGDGLNGFVPTGWGPSTVSVFCSYQGSLYAGGFIFNSGERRLDGIARFDGIAWQPVGQGVVQYQSGAVHALAPWSGRVAAGGDFYVYDPVRYGAGALYSFDGISMSGDLGGTSDFSGHTVRAAISIPRSFPQSNDLYVGGDFTTVRNGAVESAQWARFSETGTPWFARQISNSGESCVGGVAKLSSRVAAGYEAIGFQWFRDGVPLSDGPTSTGSFVSGVDTDTITISNLSGGDSADYQVVANSCGNATTGTFALDVCEGDLTCDQVVNDADFVLFVGAYSDLVCP